MELDFSSIFFGNYSNLIYLSLQCISLILSLILHKKGRVLAAILIMTSVSFALPLYMGWEFYQSYQFFISHYTFKKQVPLYVILPGIESTEAFLILVTLINALSIALIFRILKRNLNNAKK